MEEARNDGQIHLDNDICNASTHTKKKQTIIQNILYMVLIYILECLNVQLGNYISVNLFSSCLPSCRSFAKPPKQVQVVCECILVLRGYKEISWQSAKGMMSEANFLRSLMEMDCDSINNNQVRTVRGKST